MNLRRIQSGARGNLGKKLKVRVSERALVRKQNDRGSRKEPDGGRDSGQAAMAGSERRRTRGDAAARGQESAFPPGPGTWGEVNGALASELTYVGAGRS